MRFNLCKALYKRKSISKINICFRTCSWNHHHYTEVQTVTQAAIHIAPSSINRSLTLPRNSSNLSSSKQAKKKFLVAPCRMFLLILQCFLVRYSISLQLVISLILQQTHSGWILQQTSVMMLSTDRSLKNLPLPTKVVVDGWTAKTW